MNCVRSLEVMCLLLALKLKHPKQIHLIRGNHEDAAINGTYGFKEECKRRLEESPDQAGSCWNAFNTVSDDNEKCSNIFDVVINFGSCLFLQEVSMFVSLSVA